MKTKGDYLEILKSDFVERQRAIPKFSLRSYAKLLNTSPGNLSRILSGRIIPSNKVLKTISEELNLAPETKELFFRSAHHKKLITVLNNLLKTPANLTSSRLGDSVIQESNSLVIEAIDLDPNLVAEYQIIAKEFILSLVENMNCGPNRRKYRVTYSFLISDHDP